MYVVVCVCSWCEVVGSVWPPEKTLFQLEFAVITTVDIPVVSIQQGSKVTVPVRLGHYNWRSEEQHV